MEYGRGESSLRLRRSKEGNSIVTTTENDSFQNFVDFL